jgi:hypothetical protein
VQRRLQIRWGAARVQRLKNWLLYLTLALLAGCAWPGLDRKPVKERTIPANPVWPALPPAPLKSSVKFPRITQAPARPVQVIPIALPDDYTNGFWTFEASSNLVDWVPIVRNCCGPQKSEGDLWVTNGGTGTLVIRGRKQAGYEP